MSSAKNSSANLFPTQNADGVDLARLEANLRLSPTERVEKAQKAARFVCEVGLAAYTTRLRKTS